MIATYKRDIRTQIVLRVRQPENEHLLHKRLREPVLPAYRNPYHQDKAAVTGITIRW